MENILIESKSDTFFRPYVNFNADTAVCEIAGESYLEDTNAFFRPLFAWLDTYLKQINKPLQFNFRLTYFNTSSSKCLLDLIRRLKEFEIEGGKVEVNWYYASDDDDMKEEAEDFMLDTNIKMKLIAYDIED